MPIFGWTASSSIFLLDFLQFSSNYVRHVVYAGIHITGLFFSSINSMLIGENGYLLAPLSGFVRSFHRRENHDLNVVA